MKAILTFSKKAKHPRRGQVRGGWKPQIVKRTTFKNFFLLGMEVSWGVEGEGGDVIVSKQ